MAQDQARDNSPLSAAKNAAIAAAAAAADAAPGASVMGRDILVTGNIEASVDLMIEGRVIGDVTCATLVLGPDSSITGSIRAERVRVSGKVEGAIETVELAIEASAQVKGDVSYTRIRIANGALVQGTLVHKAGPAEDAMTDTKLKLVEPAKAAEPATGKATDGGKGAEPAKAAEGGKLAQAVRYFE